ncbi:LysR family transcriptional regulator [Neisseriaceae bacterium CLB008]
MTNTPQHKFSMHDYALNRLKLRPLVIFERVLASHSIVHAADQLHLSQPAVTKAVKELESQLGVQLFHRSKNGMQPTEVALVLGKRVKSLFSELRTLTDEINSFHHGNLGHIVIGTLLSASAELLPKAIIQFKQQHPNILITIKVGTVEELFPSLLKGELDLVVGRLPSMDSKFYQVNKLTHQALYDEKLSLVVAHNHELLNHDHLALKDLMDYPWILPLGSASMRANILTYFNEQGVGEPSNLVESVSILTNMNVIAQSNFIGCMSSVVATQLVDLNLLAKLPFPDIGEPTAVGFSQRRDAELNPACLKFIDCLKLTLPH